MSLLSEASDGLGFFYGFSPGDSRQINVRLEDIIEGKHVTPGWVYYVGGERIGVSLSKGEAEREAIAWAKKHPES